MGRHILANKHVLALQTDLIYTSWVVYHNPTANPTWLTAVILTIAMTS